MIDKPLTIEQWEKEYNILDNIIEVKDEIIKDLKAENERLKEENEELCKKMAAVTYRATGGRLSYSNYTLDAIEQAFYDQLDILSDKKIEPYKQTLQEIKEYLNTLSVIDNDFVNTETYLRILNLITKAEEE